MRAGWPGWLPGTGGGGPGERSEPPLPALGPCGQDERPYLPLPPFLICITTPLCRFNHAYRFLVWKLSPRPALPLVAAHP